MPKIPEIKTMTANSVQLLNAVRNDMGPQSAYWAHVPYATNTTESIRAIGDIMQTFPVHQNEFLSALVNRIGRVLITSKMYSNPWAGLKKGLLEFGETVEEIFANLADPNNFDPEVAETELFKRVIPDVRAAFHSMNYQKFYKVTVSNDQLRQAFLSWDGITDLIGRIVDTLYTGANYDEFLTMKYLIARLALAGKIHPVKIEDVTAANSNSIVTTMKGISNLLPYMSSDYNMAGVKTTTPKADQYFITSAKFNAIMDVNTLASAFNIDYVEFMGRRIEVDSFGTLDNERLALLFKNDPTYVEITQAELTALDNIPALIIDRDWFMVFDNFYNFTEQYNGQGLYWNYFYHVWKTFSASPFANAVLFTTNTPAVTSVTVTPDTASVAKGGTLQMAATVVTDGFASKDVIWTVSGGTASTISESGLLTVGAGETGSTLTITATSKVDDTKIGTATITVPA
jgi:hypothetical protein